ncbi:MAG TPA: hypothetical protein ENK94_01015 [Campylobacterales bacterium]|nr:hypothetical protein [Campylobacterales bacterium]
MKLLNTAILAVALTLTAFASETKVQPQTPESLLSFVNIKDAKGDVKAVYDEITKAWGFVPIVLKQYSLNPKILRIQWELYKELGENKNFDPKMLTMMRMLLGEAQDCTYCLGLNKGMLLNMFKVPMDEVVALSKDPNTAKLDEKQKTMLLFILKAVKTPHDTNAKDIEGLKKLGWSDKDIFEGVKSGTNVIAATLLIDALKLQKDF